MTDPADRLELGAIGEAIVAGVRRSLTGWLEREAARVLDAWGRLASNARAADSTAVRVAAQAAADRIATELAALFALEPAAQLTTPLEIVRTAYREPTAVFRAAGVPEVVRDPFDERASPGDVYGLVPRTFADLGDEELAPLHLAWGLAKARALRPDG